MAQREGVPAGSPAGFGWSPAGFGWCAWALVLVVLLSWSLAAGAVVVGAAPSAGPGPTTTAPGAFGDRADEDRHVVLVGVPGLTWDLVDEVRTPTLAQLAGDAGAAALVVRGRGRGDVRGRRLADGGCGAACGDGSAGVPAWREARRRRAGRWG